MKHDRPPRIPSLFIGVDGGGSGCRARIEDADGRVLGTGTAGPAAVRLGIETVMTALTNACLAATADAGLPPEALIRMDAGIGLAGVGRQGALERIKAWPHPFHSVTYVNDANIACLGAHGGREGGIVIVGTGSVGFAIVGGREIRLGGYGFPISDEGSGADLGLQAIRMALRAQDGRISATTFTLEVMERFQDDPFEAVTWMDRATATDYARFAPMVMQHAEAGDGVAREIVSKAAEQIDDLIRQLQGSGAQRVALLGGLAAPMQPWLAPDIQRSLSAVEGDALDGALYLARRAALETA